MPIARAAPEAPSTLKPNVVAIATDESTSIVVDTRYTPLSSLLTYIVGASWTVQYFSQIINKDNDLRGQDAGQSAIYQQYTNIQGLELKVVSSLTQSQEPDTKRMTVSGTATLYPFMIPNEGDMFAADAGDGREAVFRVKSSERKSHLRETIYQIEYDLVYYSDADKVRRTDLDTKSIRVLHFRKDFLQHGQNPLLIESDSNAIDELGQKFSEITKDYFSWFLNRDLNTFLIPGQLERIYDHYVTTAILSILTTRDAPDIIKVRRLNVDADPFLNQAQLWEALLKRDKDLLTNANVVMGAAWTGNFAKDPQMQGIAFTGARRVVYPLHPDVSLLNSFDKQPIYAEEMVLQKVATSTPDLNKILPLDVIAEPSVHPINPVMKDGKYVFSNAFYDDTAGKSVIEILTTDYLDNKTINIATLLELVKGYKRWGGLEKFYYMPILLILIKSTIRGI